MYTGLRHLHSGWRYIVLLLLIIAVINAISGLIGKKNYTESNRKINLFALIAAHTQLLIGLVLYFVSTKVMTADIAAAMKIPVARYWTVEHVLMNVIAIVLITVGYSKSKKALGSAAKYKSIAVFYTIALALILTAILMAVGKGFITFWGFSV